MQTWLSVMLTQLLLFFLGILFVLELRNIRKILKELLDEISGEKISNENKK